MKYTAKFKVQEHFCLRLGRGKLLVTEQQSSQTSSALELSFQSLDNKYLQPTHWKSFNHTKQTSMSYIYIHYSSSIISKIWQLRYWQLWSWSCSCVFQSLCLFISHVWTCTQFRTHHFCADHLVLSRFFKRYCHVQSVKALIIVHTSVWNTWFLKEKSVGTVQAIIYFLLSCSFPYMIFTHKYLTKSERMSRQTNIHMTVWHDFVKNNPNIKNN